MSELHVLLLSDIVDSTRLNAQLGDGAMATLWQAHDQAARELLRHWHGREIRRSDGFVLLFGDAADALGFASGYHQALAALTPPLRARVGVHRGALTLRENSAADREQGAPAWEIDGVALPVAARVMDLARGGQTLLSAAAHAALAGGARHVQSHGFWQLKGVDEPVELFEAGDGSAPFTPPPDSAKAWCVLRSGELWLPRRQLRHTLPAEPDGFVGRQPELKDLATRFDAGTRLVSVLGIGGTGKTRLALRFGWAWLGAFPGGVWFCDLAAARSLDGIAQAVARGLEVPLGGAEPVAQLAASLAGRGNCLVILDNFEQVARHADETLGRWAERAPEARFLVTTREVLGLPGEAVVNLAPLPAADSVSLFMRRAAAASTAFAPGAEDRAAIEPLVRLLDGLPLAIELAAVRVRVMTPRMLLQRMSERFKLLAAGGSRRDRQATLRSTFDWSWDLLSPAEKAALAQLSVFEGGFSLPAAEAVLDLPDGAWAVDVVQALVEKSLVRVVARAHPGDGAAAQRLELLQSVQDYAAEHLATPGRFDGSGPAALAAAQARHWRHYAAADEAAALADGGADLDNLVAACRRAAADGDPGAAAGALVAAWLALRITGPFRAALSLSAPLRGHALLPLQQRAAVAWVSGAAAARLGDNDAAQPQLESGRRLAEAAGAATLEGDLLCELADLHMTRGALADAEEALQRALALADAGVGPALRLKARNGLGALAIEQGRFADAHEHWQAALALARRLQDPRWQGGLLSNLGALHYGEGRLDEAERHYEAALALVRTVGDRRWEGSARCNLALLQHELGRPAQALAQLQATLTVARELGDARLELTVLCNLGIVAEALGEHEAARGHYEQAVAGNEALGDRRAEGQFRGYLGLLLARQGHHAQAQACLQRAETLLRDGADAISLGLLLCQAGQARALGGDTIAARAALDEAAALLDDTGGGIGSELGRALVQARLALSGPAD